MPRVEKVFTDAAFHEPRRRVKFFPCVRNRGEDGQDVIVDNSAWVGDYPILWSRPAGGGQRLIVMLVDMDKGTTAHGVMAEADFLKLPETEIEW